MHMDYKTFVLLRKYFNCHKWSNWLGKKPKGVKSSNVYDQAFELPTSWESLKYYGQNSQ